MAPQQRTLLGFFQKTPSKESNGAPPTPLHSTAKSQPTRQVGAEKSPNVIDTPLAKRTISSPITHDSLSSPLALGSQGRGGRARKRVKYAESEDEDGVPSLDKDSSYEAEDAMSAGIDDDADDDEMHYDDSDDEPVKTKRRAKPVRSQALTPVSIEEEEAPGSRKLEPTGPSRSLSEFHASSTTGQNTPSLLRESSSRISNAALMTREEKIIENADGYAWLKPENIKDADGHRPGEPGYDPGTLYIPKSALNKFSPFEGQFWEFKRRNWGSIIFFQKGKFYELYEDDAVLGHQLFDLKLTSRGMRMVGVPDYTFDHWAAQFIAKGHRVARVDQMESILGKELRDRQQQQTSAPGKKDKIVRRELTQILTQGTLVDQGMLQSDMATYVMSIKEADAPAGEVATAPRFGVAFADAATGAFQLSYFTDDASRTKLDTLLSQTRPREVVLEKGRLSPKSFKTIRIACPTDTIYVQAKPEEEFWDSERTLLELREARYFGEQSLDDWPIVVREMKENDEQAGLSALGGLISYLRSLKLDRDLCSIRNFTEYDPLRRSTSLVLDGQSLINLEIFQNTWNGGAEGTLFEFLNRCVTPFGKRLLKMWVCHPLQDALQIEARLNAIEALNQSFDLKDVILSGLTRLPDLERMMSRIHVGRCRVGDFVRVLEGMSHLVELVRGLKEDKSLADKLLRDILEAAPDMQEHVTYWRNAFDWDAAKTTASNRDTASAAITPTPGAEEEYDQSQAAIDAVEAQFPPLLKQYKSQLKCSKLEYRHLGASKEVYQIEVPAEVSVPKDWQRMSSTKAVVRYWSPEVRILVKQLLEAQELHKVVAEGVQARFMQKFDADYRDWMSLVTAVAKLDCLCSLASSSLALGEEACRPELVGDSSQPTVEFGGLRHPCNADFIPNDVVLGGQKANLSLLTGPNMAGKSTLLRSVCVGVVLAQLGHLVPATSCRLTPLDQVSVRTGGARDNAAAGQSTFMVELQETSAILASATSRSLVVLDELGRGTSTHDGAAIAQAVLHYLATTTHSLGFFSTHYSRMATAFHQLDHLVRPQCMAYKLDEHGRRVTFLYKLIDGVCSHSHGLNVARLAGLPDDVVEAAARASESFANSASTHNVARVVADLDNFSAKDLLSLAS
ncbi:DNA mismatch repair protein msh6 [Savitreella phatthalungensis]